MNTIPKKTPSVKPSRRARQAEDTRQEILAAARALFAAHGYRRTSVKDVAAAAGVSVQTVYDSVGSKRSLVLQLNDVIDREAGVRPLAAEALASGDVDRVVALPAAVTRAIVEACGDIVRTSLANAADEPEIADVLREGRRRHRLGVTATTARLRELRALAADADLDAAIDTISAVCDVEVALMLADGYGWTLDRVESWMTDAVRRLVPPARRSRR